MNGAAAPRATRPATHPACPEGQGAGRHARRNRIRVKLSIFAKKEQGAPHD